MIVLPLFVSIGLLIKIFTNTYTTGIDKAKIGISCII